MKRILILAAVFFISYNSNAQSYFKGEWTKLNKNDLFTGIFKITIKNVGTVSGELLWTYLAIDSSDNFLKEHYKGKKGRSGIEYVVGTIDTKTNEIYFEGKSKDDPNDILGLDKYSLKLSANKKVLYGKTDSNGGKDGMFYGIKMNAAAGAKEFNAIRSKMKHKKHTR